MSGFFLEFLGLEIGGWRRINQRNDVRRFGIWQSNDLAVTSDAVDKGQNLNILTKKVEESPNIIKLV